MTLSNIVLDIVVLGLALFIFNRLVPSANAGYYAGIAFAVVLLLYLLGQFGGVHV